MARSFATAALLLSSAAFGMVTERDNMVQTAEVIPGEYIVMLHETLAKGRFNSHMEKARSTFGANMINSFEELSGYAIKNVDATMVEELNAMEEVAVVVPNQMYHIQQTCRNESVRSWGLQRTVQQNAVPNTPFNYNYDTEACGEGIDLYILDTGARETHEDLRGRTTWIQDYTTERRNVDGNGHGSHVSSTAGGSNYGIARCSNIYELKVCNSQGQCPGDASLAAVNRIIADARAGKKIVGNMSLGGPKFPFFPDTLSDAVDQAVDAGAVMVVAAGNSNADSCGFSPAAAVNAITVMSSEQSDTLSSFSNYGACSDIIAPGGRITAAWFNGDTAYQTISGTSMASPHVAGVAAKFWSANPNLTPAEVKQGLLNLSLDGMIRPRQASTVDKLLNMPCA